MKTIVRKPRMIKYYCLGNNLVYYLLVIGLMSRVFVNGPRDRGSILGRVIPKTQKNGT